MTDDGQKNSGPSADQPRSSADERLDRALANLIAARKLKEQNAAARAKPRFHISRGDLTRYTVLLILCLVGVKLIQDQYNLKRQHDELRRTEASKLINPEELQLSELELKAKALDPATVAAPSLAHYPIKTVWSDVVRCSLNARWSDLSSPNFLRMEDDFAVGYMGGSVYVFTPTLAAKQRIFRGPFWQKLVTKFLSLVGKNPKSLSPAAVLALPYTSYESGSLYEGFHYVKVYRFGAVERLFPSTIGDALLGKDWLHLEESLQPALESDGFSVDPAARAMLAKEIKLQLRRYAKSGPSPGFSLINIADPYNYDQETHRSCLVAADFLNLPELKAAANTELQLLKQEGIKRQRLAVTISRMASLSGSFPTATVAAHASLNSHALTRCMQEFHQTVAPIGFSVRRAGDVDPASITLPERSDEKYKACIVQELKSWRLSGPLNNPIQRFDMELRFVAPAH